MLPNRPGALSKAGWREAIIAAVASLDADVRRGQEAVLLRSFPQLPGFVQADTVMLYVTAFPEELPTDGFFATAYQAGKRVVCPRVDRSARRLRLHRVEDPGRDLRPGVLGIPEPSPVLPEVAPESVDWVLVPGLAFDERGYRLGRGAGHYDRLLPR